MEKIKNQVNTIVVYKGATFQELDQEYNDLGARIEKGIERMKAALAVSEYSKMILMPVYPRTEFEDYEVCYGL